uniref:Uncharacterized protein n=1 Tax=Arundo donax TaxID=35708 RepID=A0A0A9HPB8_ARUDO
MKLMHCTCLTLSKPMMRTKASG